MRVFPLLGRLANSLFIIGRSQFAKPDQRTTTNFQSHLSEEHCRRGIRFLLNTRPHLKSSS